MIFFLFAPQLLIPFCHHILKFLNFFNFSIVVFFKLFFLLLKFDSNSVLIILIFLLNSQSLSCLLDFSIKLIYSLLKLYLRFLETILLNFSIIKLLFFLIIFLFLTGVPVLDFLDLFSQIINPCIDFRMLSLKLWYFFDSIFLLIEKRHLLACQLVSDFYLLIQLFLEFVLFVFLLYFDIFKPFHTLSLNPKHLIFVSSNQILDVAFFLLELLSLNL